MPKKCAQLFICQLEYFILARINHVHDPYINSIILQIKERKEMHLTNPYNTRHEQDAQPGVMATVKDLY